jgi:hypothetical protein
MNKWKAAPIGVGIFAVIFCSGVFAQVQAPPRAGRDSRPDPRMEQALDMMFQDMDTNHDGKISKKEWMAAQEKQFDRLDRSKDGFISRDEVIADMNERMREKPQPPERGGAPQ